MTAYRREDRGNRWHCRRVVQLPDGSRKRIRGPAPVNTKRSAEEAERAHVEYEISTHARIEAGDEPLRTITVHHTLAGE